ncbi:MAG: VacJ family lipoprotein [Sulfurimonas sp.]|nr:VacJ family lipoprotein [Sulfurimonas sp.]
MKLLYILCLALVFFTGCSSKDISQINASTYPQEKKLTTDEDMNDELFDEFEDDTKTKDIFDPFSGYNRFMTSFNDKLYIYALTPISRGYNTVIHYEIRKSISNLFNNLQYPTRVTNNILQAKFQNAAEETGRFVLNTTIGILGLFDPAKNYFNLEAHEEDFGQTLGYYGVGGGPHIVLPLFGPSNLRDAISIIPDSYLNPIDYTNREWFTLTDTWWTYLGAKSYEYVNEFSLNVDSYDRLKEDSIDLYPYLRDVYEQYRDKQIKE